VETLEPRMVPSAASEKLVGHLYADLLHRSPEPVGLAYWSGLLDQGVPTGILAGRIAGSYESRVQHVQDFYAAILHRTADAQGLDGFVGFLGMGGTLEQVQSFILGSPEYVRQSSASPNSHQITVSGDDARFLEALYHDVLNRGVDPTGADGFGRALAVGVSHQEIAAAVVASLEARQDRVQGLYRQFLKRSADETGLNAFFEAMKAGARDEDLVAGILGGPEYAARITGGVLPGDVAASTNLFGFNLYQRLARQSGNQFFSPLSIEVAMGMVLAGAQGQTRNDLAQVLSLTGDPNAINAGFAQLLAAINGDGSPRPFDLRTANALWGALASLNPDYAKLSADDFGGSLHPEDFAKAKEQAVSDINAWAAEQTRGKIQQAIDPDVIKETTRLVLTNATYFNGKWESPFDPAATHDAPFYVHPDQSVTVSMMHGWHVPAKYTETDDAQVLDLPYEGGRLSMMVVLPKNINGLQEVESNWSAARYQSILSALAPTSVEIRLPRFKVSTGFSLKEALIAMGAGSAFSDGADFSGIFKGERVKLDDVIHKAVVDVTEKGTEAAATTVPVFIPVSLDTTVFRADHPFLFLIRDQQTGAIVFSGRLSDPSAAPK
jgi:serpin B